MDLGLSLFAHIIKSPVTASMEWREALSESPDGLELARNLGVNVIELKTESPDNPTLSDVIHKVKELDFKPTFHKSILHPGYKRSCIQDFYDFYYSCLMQGITKPLVVFHALEGEHLFPVEHRQASSEIINNLGKRFNDIEFSLENCRKRKKRFHGCDCYETTMRVVDRCKRANIGICWDLGHSYYNYMCWKYDFIPPREFLERVNNVHIHDVCGKETHHPLQDGQIPLDEVISALNDVGYKGALTIEIYPERLANCQNFAAILLDMCQKITSIQRKLKLEKTAISGHQAS